MTNKIKYFLSLTTINIFFSHVMLVFGTIWLLIEFPSSVNISIKAFFDRLGNSTLLYSLFISLACGIYCIWPKKKLFKKFSASNTSIELIVGDIFKQEGNFAISSSNFYDTNFDIANLSLKSQLINKCFSSDTAHIDRLIEQSLDEQQIIGVIDAQKISGKNLKYPIGTVVKLSQNNRFIFTLVISELIFEGTRKHTLSNPEMLNDALNKFWAFLKTEGRIKPISVPVFGSGLARINLSYKLLVQSIILSFVTFSKTTRITEKLTIVVSEECYSPKDFEEIDRFLDSIEI